MSARSIDRTVPRISLNRDEVALAIGVSATTVDVMVEEGALPRPRVWHSRKVWLVSALEAAVREWPEAGTPAGKQKGDADDDSEDWRASL